MEGRVVIYIEWDQLHLARRVRRAIMSLGGEVRMTGTLTMGGMNASRRRLSMSEFDAARDLMREGVLTGWQAAILFDISETAIRRCSRVEANPRSRVLERP